MISSLRRKTSNMKLRDNKDRRMCIIQNDLYDHNSLNEFDKSSLSNSSQIDSETSCYDINRDNQSYMDNNLDTRSDMYTELSNVSNVSKISNVQCNLCNLESNKGSSNYIILSCCNNIFHVKCLVDKYNVYNVNDENSIDDHVVFDEKLINKNYLDKVKCNKCDTSLNYEDLFTLHSKNILCNKNYAKQYHAQLLSLKDQRNKIDNEIKCLNEYISKLDHEKKVSYVMMAKTYSLLTE